MFGILNRKKLRDMLMSAAEYVEYYFVPEDEFFNDSFEEDSYSIDEFLDSDYELEKTFTESLISIIDSKQLRDTDVYKAAHIDRRLFSKIVSDREYSPSKDTALALVFALKLSPDEAMDLLSRAGYSLSHSIKRDLILEFLLQKEEYDLIYVNEVLYSLGQKPLGR